MYKEFLQLAHQNYSQASCLAIEQALRLAVSLLEPYKRWDGSPFVEHSVAVARIVMQEIGLGRNTTVAALLHDLARLDLITKEQVRQEWGEATLNILLGMNNISELEPKTSTRQAENYKELIISYSTDPRVILLKMADRLEVMRSLDAAEQAKRYKKSWETLHLYAPIAHKLGLYNIKSEMEDLSLKYLESGQYDEIVRNLAESDAERRAFIDDFTAPIVRKLDSLGIVYKLKSRTKSVYSIWKKMQKQHVAFDQVFDLFAIRIIIDCPQEVEKMQCWTVFSVITDFYTPNPDRMRDWISIPKSNGYESLHATVVTPTGRWVEVQIRTQRMDETAERGVAAHWRYKGVAGGDRSSEVWLERLRNIVENNAAGEPIKEEFDVAASSSEVFVFTPLGDLRKLPVGATVLDFAFDIHSGLGATCTAGRVNGRVVPIRESLHSGDIVEVITSKSQKPKPDWLSIAKTGKARSCIRQIMRAEQAASSELGREELERKLKNWKIPLSVDEAVGVLVKHFKVRTGVEVYTLIAQQGASMAQVKALLVAASASATTLPYSTNAPNLPSSNSATSLSTAGSSTFVASGGGLRSGDNSADPIVFQGDAAGLGYKFARCCNPIFGDDIFGFVTINAGVTIHRADCPNATRLKQQYPYRVINTAWRTTGADGAFVATLQIRGDDVAGLAAAISDVLSHKMKINIRSMSFTTRGVSMEGVVSVEVKNNQMLDAAIHAVRRVKGVLSVVRSVK